MTLQIQKLKIPIILIAVGTLTLGFVCSGMSTYASLRGTSMESGMVTPIDNQECCNTSISNLVVPREIRDKPPLLLLGLLTTLTFGLFRFLYPSIDQRVRSYRLYARDNPDLPLFNHLKLAFAQGILNPKIY